METIYLQLAPKQRTENVVHKKPELQTRLNTTPNDFSRGRNKAENSWRSPQNNIWSESLVSPVLTGSGQISLVQGPRNTLRREILFSDASFQGAGSRHNTVSKFDVTGDSLPQPYTTHAACQSAVLRRKHQTQLNPCQICTSRIFSSQFPLRLRQWSPSQFLNKPQHRDSHKRRTQFVNPGSKTVAVKLNCAAIKHTLQKENKRPPHCAE